MRIGERGARRAVIGVFVFIALVGALWFGDYGVSVDEPTELWTAQYNYDLVKNLLLGSNSADRDPDADAYLLDSFALRFYGTALQMPLIVLNDAVRLLRGYPLEERAQYLLRHLWTFLLFYGALICFYRSLMRQTGRRWLSLAGTGMLWLCPRIFAQAFYNIKDIPFLCCMVFLAAATQRMLQSGRKPRWCLLVAALGALTVSVRTIGAIWLVLLVFAMLVSDLSGRRFSPGEVGARGFKRAVPYLLVCCAFPIWLLLMPCSWSAPVAYVQEAVQTFLNYVTWRGDSVFNGRLVAYNEVPRGYFLVWMGLTIPLVYQLLAAVGIVAFVRRGIRKPAKGAGSMDAATRTVMVMLLAVLVIVPGYQILTKPVVYNGWRHVFFLYPMLVAFAVDGLSRMLDAAGRVRGGLLRAAIIAAVSGSLLFNAAHIAWAHPYEYATYNVIGMQAAKRFDRDYWKLSNRQAFQYLLDTEDGEISLVCLDGAYEPFLTGEQIFTDAQQARLRFAGSLEHAAYAVVNCRYLIDTNTLELPGFTEVAAFGVDGVKLVSVQQRLGDG